MVKIEKYVELESFCESSVSVKHYKIETGKIAPSMISNRIVSGVLVVSHNLEMSCWHRKRLHLPVQGG